MPSSDPFTFLTQPNPLLLREILESRPAFEGMPFADKAYLDMHESAARWIEWCDW